jgi:TolA-binding protein
MINTLEKPRKRGNKPRLSLATLQRQLRALQQRVEDLEDLRELNQAIERNGGKPLRPWANAKRELGLEPG